MPSSEALKAGDVIQLDPTEHTHHDGFWAGQFLLVTEVKPWGVKGFAKVPGGEAPYRAKNGTFERVGAAPWAPREDQS